MQWDYKTHWHQHRSWTGTLEAALSGLSVLTQFLDPDKASEFILQPHASYCMFITFSENCGWACALTAVLRQQIPHSRLESLLRGTFFSPHSFLEPFTGNFPRNLSLTSFSHNFQASPVPLRKMFEFFDSFFSLLVTQLEQSLIALRGGTAALKPFYSEAIRLSTEELSVCFVKAEVRNNIS